ncbi:MAG TPA: hypothetical protein VG435_19580, partial [Acidimicrobiales bacterium]|nr:hypothetical protein [Acidimicrobiales bacterium]
VTSALTAQSAAVDVLQTTSTLTGPGTVHTLVPSTPQDLVFSLQTKDSANNVVSIPTTAYSISASSASVTVCGNIAGLTCTLQTTSISGSAPTFTVQVSVPTGCFAPQTITLRLEDPTSGDTAVSSSANPVSASGTLDILPTCNLALSVGSSHSVAEPAGGTLTFPVTLTDPADSSTPRNALNTLTIPYVVSCPLAVLSCGSASGDATITAGTDSTTISVPVSQVTTAWFTPQSVTVTISAPVGNSDVAVLGTGVQSGTVTSTLPAPKVTLTPPAGLGSITLPADAGHIYTYTVTLSEPVAVPLHVDFKAQGAPGFASPAVNGVDFTVVNPASCAIGTTCVDFNVPLAGVAPLTQPIAIKFLGRGVHGPNRYFQLALAAASLGSIPSGQSFTTILTDTYAYGYWLVGTDGGVFPLGAAPYKGSAAGAHLAAQVVAIAPTPTGQGYWLASTDGGVYAYGDARFSGSMFGLPHNGVIVGIAATPTGKGYWLVGSDGGVYSFGDARFFGSMSGYRLIGSIVGIQATRDGHGYYLVGSDGGVFAFGDAVFHGSLPDYCGVCTGSSPILGLAVSPDGGGYWLASVNGGVFAFGDARYHGSGFGTGKHFEAITATSSGDGYWLLASDGTVVAEGKAQNFFDPLKAPGVHLGGPVENMAGD